MEKKRIAAKNIFPVQNVTYAAFRMPRRVYNTKFHIFAKAQRFSVFYEFIRREKVDWKCHTFHNRLFAAY